MNGEFERLRLMQRVQEAIMIALRSNNGDGVSATGADVHHLLGNASPLLRSSALLTIGGEIGVLPNRIVHRLLHRVSSAMKVVVQPPLAMVPTLLVQPKKILLHPCTGAGSWALTADRPLAMAIAWTLGEARGLPCMGVLGPHGLKKLAQ